MVDDELRIYLEEEREVITRQLKGIVLDDAESLHLKRRLENRLETIGRLLRRAPPDFEKIMQNQRHIKYLNSALLVAIVIVMAATALFHTRLYRIEQKLITFEERFVAR